MRSLTEPTLRALIAELAARGGDPPRIVAVEASPRWSGQELLDTDIGPVRVAPCVSPLAVRAALIDHRDRDGETLLVLTDLDESALGEEVLGRVWKGRLVRPSSWESLRQLAKVDRLDPQLAGERWLVDLLVEVAPTRGYPAATSGVLSLDAAWRLAYRHALHLEADRPQLSDLLAWAQTDSARDAVARLADSSRAAVATHLATAVHPAARHLVALAAEGRGGDAIPLGLVVDVLWRDPTDLQLGYQRGKFESELGHGKLDDAAAGAWGRAAAAATRAAVGDRDDHGSDVVIWTGRAEQLLDGLDALDETAASDVLPTGFEHRLEQAGYALAALVTSLEPEKLDAAEACLAAVCEHLSAAAHRHRVTALRSATRLARRLVTPPADAGEDLAALARTYERDGGWVDDARHTLEAETVAPLADAYGRLLDAVDTQRVARDRRFAAALAAWSTLAPDPDGQLLAIEQLLDRVLAPIAQSTPVLLLIVDGMSHAASHPLLTDLGQRGWRRHVPATAPLPPVIAAIPTVTVVSRASQLTGQLTVGGQDIERDGFSAHPGLVAASGSKPPRLFHKADLGEVGGQVAPAVQEALLDPDQRVVGIVVNAVDDHLAKGGQLRLADGLAGVRPLGPILAAAAEARRTVVLTSDHGHVVEQGSDYLATGQGGERWREADPASSDDEVLISGPRVLRGDGRIVAAATDRLRYVTDRKRGYHGGATPAEALCPLAVLVPSGLELDGWVPALPERPLWWDQRSGDAVPDPTTTGRTGPPRGVAAADVPKRDAKGVPVLFADPADTAAAPSDEDRWPEWIVVLLASPQLEHQRAMSGRASIDDGEVAELVALLAAAGGTLPAAAIAERTGTSPMRMRGKLDALKRLLNLDGYEVLEVRSDGTVQLNLPLLGTQFGVTPS